MFLLVISIVSFPLSLGKSALTLCHSGQLFLFISLVFFFPTVSLGNKFEI